MRVRHSWQSFSGPSMTNFNFMFYCASQTVKTAKLQRKEVMGFLSQASHTFLLHFGRLSTWQPTRSTASLLLMDSLPLQERCKWEELWLGCYLTVPGSQPVDNMLTVSDKSGSLSQPICFIALSYAKFSKKARRRTCYCLHICCFWCTSVKWCWSKMEHVENSLLLQMAGYLTVNILTEALLLFPHLNFPLKVLLAAKNRCLDIFFFRMNWNIKRSHSGFFGRQKRSKSQIPVILA